MSSFAQDIYPHRHNRSSLTQSLLSKVDTNWTRVVPVGHASSPPGDVLRCVINGSRIQCNYTPTFLDKRRIRALLKAWGRTISDRYLDLNRINNLDSRRHDSEQAAFDLLRQNAPRGAVMFIMNSISQSRQPYFIGQNLWEGWGYNEYFSALLNWDDRHCYGLINTLRREQGRYGAGGTPGHLWAATRRWLASNQDKGIYREVGLRVD
ncbi:MAG: hypothetical protein AB2535_17620 [Candidatus Thiodiazotropha endolucinida]